MFFLYSRLSFEWEGEKEIAKESETNVNITTKIQHKCSNADVTFEIGNMKNDEEKNTNKSNEKLHKNLPVFFRCLLTFASDFGK